MAQVSILEAAKLVGKDRKTLYRDIKKGRLSATVGDSGMSQIDTTELLRVYNTLSQSVPQNATDATASVSQRETANATDETARLKAENAVLRAQLEAKDANLLDLRQMILLLNDKTDNKIKKRWWQL